MYIHIYIPIALLATVRPLQKIIAVPCQFARFWETCNVVPHFWLQIRMNLGGKSRTVLCVLLNILESFISTPLRNVRIGVTKPFTNTCLECRCTSLIGACRSGSGGDGWTLVIVYLSALTILGAGLARNVPDVGVTGSAQSRRQEERNHL